MDRKEFFKRITELIKQEEFEKARLALKKYLRKNPKDSQAWYLRSFVVPEREKKIEALQRAFWLDPTYVQAQERLDVLLAEDVADIPLSPGRRLWRAFLQILILLLIGTLIALGIYAYIDPNADDEDSAGAATETADDASPDADDAGADDAGADDASMDDADGEDAGDADGAGADDTADDAGADDAGMDDAGTDDADGEDAGDADDTNDA